MKQTTKILLVTFISALSMHFSNSQSNDNLHKGHQHESIVKSEQKVSKEKDEDIVRKGKIDLKKIDANKDGKVFQDQMCWNVISDKAGKCPLCKMKLKEVTLEEAKKNLKENDFKVK